MFAGSGIYAPDGPRPYYYNTETENGHLLVKELSSHPRRSPGYPPAVNWKLYASSIKWLPSNDHYFSGIIYHDLFSFTKLTEPEGNRAICQKDLCCHVSYKMTEKQKDDIYVLGAFDGLQVVEGEYYLQVKVFYSYLDRLECSFCCPFAFVPYLIEVVQKEAFLCPSQNICFLHEVF